MSEMIDRVAKAIALQSHTENPCLEDLARRAIEAMREPTSAMLEAEPDDDGEFSKENSIFHARQFWQAMIDEALK